MTIKTKYKVGDTIYWYCDIDNEVHQAEVLFVNYAGVGYPDIIYEVKTECCGESKTLFIDENEVIESDYL